MRLNMSVMKVIGLVVAFVGVVILLCSMPGWLWLAALGLALIAGGLYLFFGRRC